MGKRLLRCLDCNRLLLLGAHNRAPAYRVAVENSEPTEVPCDDEADFRTAHDGHRLGELDVIGRSWVSAGAWGDPMRESYFEATDGREIFVVRRWRTQIDRPVMYEVIPGVLHVRPVSMEVQSRDLERQLREDFRDNPDSQLIGRLVRAVEEVAENLEYEDLEEVCVDNKDPLVYYVRFEEKHVAEILARLREDVPVGALQRFHRFILDNSEGDDVMNLIVRKTFTIRGAREGGSASAPL